MCFNNVHSKILLVFPLSTYVGPSGLAADRGRGGWGITDCHTSDSGHWLAMTVFGKGAVQVRAGRCWERIERCRWQKKREERVAAVKIGGVRRKAAQKF